MNSKHFISIAVASLLASSVWAQASTQPLNLSLPAVNSTSATPASAGSSTGTVKAGNVSSSQGSAAATTQTASSNQPAQPKDVTSGVPGVYYGDHSNTTHADVAEQSTPQCDDSTYNNAQVHGSVGMGVVSSNRMGTGGFTDGEVNVTKAFGSCDHPSGAISISIGGAQFGGGGRHGDSW